MTSKKRQRSTLETGSVSNPRKRVAPPKQKKRDREEDGENEKPARKRPDRAKRKQDAKNYRAYVVKCSFPGRMGRLLDEEVRGVLLEVIDSYVEAASKMLVRCSMVANEYLLESFRQGVQPDPDVTLFRRCMTAKASGDQLLQEVLDSAFEHHPVIERPTGDWPIVNWAVNRFFACYDNNLWMHFIPRVCSFVRDWVVRQDVEEDLVGVISATILGYSCNKVTVLPQIVWEFIDRQRVLLNRPREIKPETAPRAMLLRFMYTILSFREVHGLPGKFSLVPLNKVKRHHITICTTGLYHILSDVFRRLGERTPLWIQEVVLMDEKEAIHEYRHLMWRDTLDITGLTAGEFVHQIETDGVSMSVHFRRPKSDKRNAEVILTPEDRIVSIDPGRTHLVTACEPLDNGRYRYYTLSRRSYYQPIRNSLDKLRYWESHLSDVNAEMSLYSLRTADADQCSGYRRVYFEQYERLWAFRFHKRLSRERFHVYAVKRSILDRFFMSFMNGEGRKVKPTVLYGAARLQSHGLGGELSVPVKKVYQTCKRFYTTVQVNEYLTTKCHSVCGARMHPINNRSGQQQKPIHGLLYCPDCRLFVNRDRDACKSILHAGTSVARPHYLRFNRPYQHRRPLTMLPQKKSKKTD
eukprot:56768-Eustigmatos_ZCMA.PRE.2